MKIELSSIRLYVQLIFLKHKPLTIFCYLLLLTGLITYYISYNLNVKYENKLIILENMQNARKDSFLVNKNYKSILIKATEISADAQLKLFYGTLGNLFKVSTYVEKINDLAKLNNLTIERANYSLSYQNNGHYYIYKIIFPLQGSYSSIKIFCENIIKEFAFIALDNINFKRENISKKLINTELSITLFLSEDTLGKNELLFKKPLLSLALSKYLINQEKIKGEINISKLISEKNLENFENRLK